MDYIPPLTRYVAEQFQASIRVDSETNTRELAAVDPSRQARAAQARQALRRKFFERSARGELHWNVCLYPTDAYAQEAGMSLADFEDFAYRACMVDQADPVAAWQALRERQQRLVEWLDGKREVHILGPDTDLRVNIAGRPFINCWGDANMPDGEIFTGPRENGVNGHVRFSFPAIYRGREVEDVRLWFQDGVVVKATAAKNEDFLNETLDVDTGARRLGEFAFGTNFGISRTRRGAPCCKNLPL